VNILSKGRSPKLLLPTVTLVCVTGVNYMGAQFALKRSMKKIEYAKVLLVGHINPEKLVDGVEFQQAYNSKLDSIDEYSKYCIYHLWNHIETEYVLLIQADGYVINPMTWDQDFTNYDYIGAPWAVSDESYIDPFDNHVRVGNGGFSFRSIKLLKVPQLVDIPWEINDGHFYKHMDYKLYSEDGNICVHNRHLYESAGCKFAPLDVAMRFSIEQKIPEHTRQKTFGFHKRYPSLLKRITEKFHWCLFKLTFNR
jgi:hypothetical protein